MDRPYCSAAVVVVNYNGEGFLETCLESILHQSCRPHSIIVVDNASTDGSVALVQGRYPEVRLIKNLSNRGLGAAINQGIEAADAACRYLAILNTDVKADPEWLLHSVRTLERHQSCAACASLSLDWEGKVVDSAGTSALSLPLGVFGSLESGQAVDVFMSRHGETEFPVFSAVVTALVARMTAFQRYGLFDESYFLYFEDVDWSWRCLAGGDYILCNPKAVVYHYGYGSEKSSDLKLRIAGISETNLLATYHKNLSLPAQWILLPVLLCARILFALLYLPISRKLTLAKLRGIAAFFEGLGRGHYRSDRKRRMEYKKRSDLEVLRFSPGYGLAPWPVFRLALAWYSKMKDIHG